MAENPPISVLIQPVDRPWTVDDLERLPEDGNRYEIANGSLLVTPPASVEHGAVALGLHEILARQAPSGVKVVPTGIGVQLARSLYIPDLLVVPLDILRRGGKAIAVRHVLLVVEVLSPTNSQNDLVLKRNDYEEAGIPSYWIIDPHIPTIKALELNDTGGYEERDTIHPGMEFRTDRPFPLTINPSALR